MTNHSPQDDYVVGIFSTVAEAREAVADLERHGFSHDQLTLLTRGAESELDATRPLEQGDEMEKSAALGAAAGATLGLLASSALLIVPGIGPVLFVGAMASGITGGLVGGIVGAMSGWGVKENHVRKFEQQLRNGKSIVLVAGNPRELAQAKALIEDSEAEHVSMLAETADSTVDR